MRVPLLFARTMAVILCVGNAVGPLVAMCEPLYDRRQFPWNWLLFILVMIAASVPNAVLAVAVLGWIEPVRMSFSGLFRELAPFIVAVSTTAGVLAFIHSQRQRKLQEENLQLEQAVDAAAWR